MNEAFNKQVLLDFVWRNISKNKDFQISLINNCVENIC